MNKQELIDQLKTRLPVGKWVDANNVADLWTHPERLNVIFEFNNTDQCIIDRYEFSGKKIYLQYRLAGQPYEKEVPEGLDDSYPMPKSAEHKQEILAQLAAGGAYGWVDRAKAESAMAGDVP